MNIKNVIKSSGPLRFLIEHVGPNRNQRRAEMATKSKRTVIHKLSTSQAKRQRKAKKHRRKQGAGLRKA